MTVHIHFRVRGVVLVAAIAAILGMLIVSTVWGHRMILRDVLIAKKIHVPASDTTSAPELSPRLGSLILEEWGIYTNSPYLVKRVIHYVPFLKYEGITNRPVIPRAVLFIPSEGTDSFHVLGRANCAQKAIGINYRYTYDTRYLDEADLNATLVHELIHLQGGPFCTGSPDDLESLTQAAAIEVLAASCNYGDKISCDAFWGEIRASALASLREYSWRYLGGDKIFQWWMNTFIRTPEERDAAEKSVRFWQTQWDTLEEIVRRYGSRVWREFVLTGILFDHEFPGTPESMWAYPNPTMRTRTWKMDDAKTLMQPYLRVLWVLTPFVGW